MNGVSPVGAPKVEYLAAEGATPRAHVVHRSANVDAKVFCPLDLFRLDGDEALDPVHDGGVTVGIAPEDGFVSVEDLLGTAVTVGMYEELQPVDQVSGHRIGEFVSRWLRAPMPPSSSMYGSATAPENACVEPPAQILMGDTKILRAVIDEVARG